MPKTKSILPTLTLTIGALFGGLLGAVGGAFAGSEQVVLACYALGFLGGSCAGAVTGRRWLTVATPGEARLE